jgi:hypothetical protein
LGTLEILSDRNSIWIIYPRPNGARIAQRACFDSLLQGRGQFSRSKADEFDYQIIGALGTYQISFRVVHVEDQIVARTTTRLKVHRPFHFPELVRGHLLSAGDHSIWLGVRKDEAAVWRNATKIGATASTERSPDPPPSLNLFAARSYPKGPQSLSDREPSLKQPSMAAFKGSVRTVGFNSEVVHESSFRRTSWSWHYIRLRVHP